MRCYCYINSVSDTCTQAVRPKLALYKAFEEAAVAVDEMFNAAYLNAGGTLSNDRCNVRRLSTLPTVQLDDGAEGEDSGEESGGDDDEEDKERGVDDDDEDDKLQPDSPVSRLTWLPRHLTEQKQIDERAPSPEAVLLKSSSTNENLGPTEEDDADFAKELAKLVTDTSAESRKVDKKTALALWDTTLPPPVMRKKQKAEDTDEDSEANPEGAHDPSVMNFTLFTKRGNKQQTRQIAIPAESALAVQTRTAQMQDKVEQQHLKRLVLNYEQREEVEENKGASLMPLFAHR